MSDETAERSQFPPAASDRSDVPGTVAHVLRVEPRLRLRDYLSGRKHEPPEKSCRELADQYRDLYQWDLMAHWLAVSQEVAKAQVRGPATL